MRPQVAAQDKSGQCQCHAAPGRHGDADALPATSASSVQAFGGYRDGSGGNPMTDRSYTGHKHNDDLGLIYMNARYYVSGIARFASADTIVPDPTNPQSYNRYSYVLNSPTNLIDPSGHCYKHYEEGSDLLKECLSRVDTLVNTHYRGLGIGKKSLTLATF